MKARSNILTGEERGVLVLAAPHVCGKHLSNTEIGQRLGVSATRVKTLIHQACVKLKAHNRMEAVFFALIRREIRLNDLYSLDELAEIFSAMCPDMFRRITQLVREEMEYMYLLGEEEFILKEGKDRRQNTVLTQSERDVLILAGRGLTNKAIADTLYISISAVRTFLYRASTKLGAHERMEAVLLALKRGEIGLNDIFSFNELIQPIAPLGVESLEKIAQLLSKKTVQEPVLAVS